MGIFYRSKSELLDDEKDVSLKVSGIPEPPMDGKEIYSSLVRLCFSGNGRLSIEESKRLCRKMNGMEWGSDVGMERYCPFMLREPIYVNSDSVTYELKGVSIFNPYSVDSYLQFVGNDLGRDYLSFSHSPSSLIPMLEDFYKSSEDFVGLCNLSRNIEFEFKLSPYLLKAALTDFNVSGRIEIAGKDFLKMSRKDRKSFLDGFLDTDIRGMYVSLDPYSQCCVRHMCEQYLLNSHKMSTRAKDAGIEFMRFPSGDCNAEVVDFTVLFTYGRDGEKANERIRKEAGSSLIEVDLDQPLKGIVDDIVSCLPAEFLGKFANPESCGLNIVCNAKGYNVPLFYSRAGGSFSDAILDGLKENGVKVSSILLRGCSSLEQDFIKSRLKRTSSCRFFINDSESSEVLRRRFAICDRSVGKNNKKPGLRPTV